MHTKPRSDSAAGTTSRYHGSLHALGVLVPIRFSPVKVLPGRHPLGRAGDGLRMLRTRPFTRGEDNPRDIDKFSPPGQPQVMEWEDEAQASITLMVDVSASMNTALTRPVRNACVFQLIYSLWRAGDRVGVVLFDSEVREEIRAANLRSQMQRTAAALGRQTGAAGTDVAAALNAFVHRDQRRHSNLLFVVSDFSGEGNTDPEPAWRSSINELSRNIVPVVVSFALPGRPAHGPVEGREPGPEGLIRVREPESGKRRLAFLDRRRIARINRAERRRVSALVRRFRAAGLDALAVAGQEDAYPELVRLARVRRSRRA